jgi:hypothetical protein
VIFSFITEDFEVAVRKSDFQPDLDIGVFDA